MPTDPKIDHVAEAMGLRALTVEPGPVEVHANILAAAQVHATLALVEQQRILVEQQRIANRIAAAVAVREDLVLGGSASALSDWLHEGDGVRGYFSTNEQEWLGLS